MKHRSDPSFHVLFAISVLLIAPPVFSAPSSEYVSTAGGLVYSPRALDPTFRAKLGRVAVVAIARDRRVHRNTTYRPTTGVYMHEIFMSPWNVPAPQLSPVVRSHYTREYTGETQNIHVQAPPGGSQADMDVISGAVTTGLLLAAEAADASDAEEYRERIDAVNKRTNVPEYGAWLSSELDAELPQAMAGATWLPATFAVQNRRAAMEAFAASDADGLLVVEFGQVWGRGVRGALIQAEASLYHRTLAVVKPGAKAEFGLAQAWMSRPIYVQRFLVGTQVPEVLPMRVKAAIDAEEARYREELASAVSAKAQQRVETKHKQKLATMSVPRWDSSEMEDLRWQALLADDGALTATLVQQQFKTLAHAIAIDLPYQE